MSMYITQHDELHVEYQGIALTCPHCQTLTHLTAVAVPKFDDLNRSKPKHIGIAFRCDACAEPIFLRFMVKAYTALRVELGSNYTEVEHARERQRGVAQLGVIQRMADPLTAQPDLAAALPQPLQELLAGAGPGRLRD